MKNKIALIFFTLVLFACNSKQQNDKENTINNTKKEKIGKSKPVDSIHYQISIYDNAKFKDEIKDHKESLKKLSEKKLFLNIHNKLIQKLTVEQQSFFNTNSNYELLAVAEGNLFEENSNDLVFIVYDKENVKISILTYNGITSKYAILYEDIKVENGLENANCGSYSFGTLDYQIAEEFLIYKEETLVKNLDSYLEYSPVKITDLSKDEKFLLKDGCFAKKVSRTNLANTLCLATSSVYNNWECLRYNKTNNTFLIFYSQAFAD
ncbi:hypothetical protein GKZ90_0009045 [Flavobacterium sp. MC2016-06]|uniref:hypothetical protein n=1 Tax=Flavobacterium sp. MC2016-06 TaxID=2676308 RepID=UPI0012BA882C|nr:hypothetical protein [Flavobacterium sp. MC2016-06]MBU3859390.1 hypothetical protein [Flavobacterium sp. MC2016-06]